MRICFFALLYSFCMYYRSIGSGLCIGRYSKSNDSDSDSRAKKPDRDIPTNYVTSLLFTESSALQYCVAP